MFDPESYTIATSILFPRLLGFIYFFTFGALLFQIKGLIGENGILPIGSYLKKVKAGAPKWCYVRVPSVFWLNHSDTMLMAVTWAGTVFSVLLMAGVYPLLMLFLLYVLFLSIFSTGQDFLTYGSDCLLLEITFCAFFLLLVTPANILVWVAINIVLFRFYFHAGVVKLKSGDPSWRDLTAVSYHYLSQPLPNTQAWYADKLPMWFHKVSTFLMLFVELVVPFAIFGPDVARLWVFYIFLGFQVAIWTTGNMSYLNYMLVALSMILVANQNLVGFIEAPSIAGSASTFITALCWGVGALLVAMHLAQLWILFFPSQTIGRWLLTISRYGVTNRYGVYAVMPKGRREVVVEGSDDEVNWKEYLFYYKPSEIYRRPRRVSPYEPRLDRQAWYLPQGEAHSKNWFLNFAIHLLKGTPEVLALLRENPFRGKPPKFIRSVVYTYTYTSFDEKRVTGNWWSRSCRNIFTNTIVLRKEVDQISSNELGRETESS